MIERALWQNVSRVDEHEEDVRYSTQYINRLVPTSQIWCTNSEERRRRIEAAGVVANVLPQNLEIEGSNDAHRTEFALERE